MNRKWLLLVVLAVLLGAACKKYEFGPYVSLNSKKQRIRGTWIVESAIDRFGAEIGPVFSGYRFSFSRKDSARIEFSGRTLNGLWDLEEEKDLFVWKNLEGDTLGFYFNRNERFDILRLTGNDFWLADKDNTFLYLIPAP
jgi:hypothetical protein